MTVIVTKATKPELRILYRPVLDPVKDVVRIYRAEPVLTRMWSHATMHKLALFVQNAREKATLVQAARYECRGVDGPLFGDPKPEIGPRASAAELGCAKT